MIKNTILLIATFMTLGSLSSVYANDCIAAADMEEISMSFKQFDRFMTGKRKYCAEDIDGRWFDIAKSLVLLKNASPDEPRLDSDDAMTFKAISEKDWWSYFTNRASSFTIDDNCRTGVVAYVYPFIRGDINLCGLFFELTISSQASTLMHEVRHFDGYRHVTCTQGNEDGQRGACDERITDRGSYAISLQTLVGLARSEQTPSEEKGSLEAEAVYMAFNKFNRVPKVDIENTVILSNTKGEIYRWSIDGDAELVKTLREPAVIKTSSSNLTFFPLDPAVDAYRMDGALVSEVENPGLYAKFYNEESVRDRARYSSISYFGTGGLLKGDQIVTYCDTESGELYTTDLSANYERIILLPESDSDTDQDSYLLSANGELVKYECRSNNSDQIKLASTPLKMDMSSGVPVQTFIADGTTYVLLEDGTLNELSQRGNTFSAKSIRMPISNEDWVSAAPMLKARVF